MGGVKVVDERGVGGPVLISLISHRVTLRGTLPPHLHSRPARANASLAPPPSLTRMPLTPHSSPPTAGPLPCALAPRDARVGRSCPSSSISAICSLGET